MIFKIAIVGKPNVGKSTLFNKLCDKRLAIVNELPGVTRDKKQYAAHLWGIDFIAVDTAGWEKSNTQGLHTSMVQQTVSAVQEANVVLFMIDGKGGVSSDDLDFATLIRKHKSNNETILVINKSEGKAAYTELDQNYLFKFGLGEPLYISALHGLGFDTLYERLSVIYKKNNDVIKTADGEILEQEHKEEHTALPGVDTTSNIILAIVGRPNVGKSTLFNKIIGYERVITAEQAGTTRDSISEAISIKGEIVSLIDTAGMRKKSKIDDQIEVNAVGQSIAAIRRAHVVILMMDALHPFEKQDLSIAHIAINEGKCVVIVLNKCDLVENVAALRKYTKYELSHSLTDIEETPVIYFSALYDKDVIRLLEVVKHSWKQWIKQIPTSALNKWAYSAMETSPPPIVGINKQRVKIKYLTQVAVKPPTFCLFTNKPAHLPKSYIKYLKRSLAERFKLYGMPLRFFLQKSFNPYSKDEK
ncbi:GTPase Der [Alphaproteobacteria bacterium]